MIWVRVVGWAPMIILVPASNSLIVGNRNLGQVPHTNAFWWGGMEFGQCLTTSCTAIIILSKEKAALLGKVKKAVA